MAGGGGGMLGQSMIDMGTRLGGKPPAPPSVPGARFTPLTPNVYSPAFSSAQTNQAPVAPIAQTPAQQVQQAGLQALMANMMAQYQNVPGALAMTQQRPQMQMPQFSAPALAYRPNMQAIQNNLRRIAPAVRPAPPEESGAEPPQTELYNWRNDPYAGG